MLKLRLDPARTVKFRFASAELHKSFDMKQLREIISFISGVDAEDGITGFELNPEGTNLFVEY